MIRRQFVWQWTLAGALTVLTGQSSHASFLVGTASGNDSLAAVQVVIDNYNAAHDLDLPAATAMVDKFEDDGFENGVFNLDDFTFYTLKPGIATNNSLAIADVFSAGNLVAIPDADFDLAEDYKVLAFTYDGAGPAPFTYYVSKNGPSFTLWSLMPGFNTVYVELSAADANFQPRNNGLSHVSFYGPVPIDVTETPEPASAGLAGLGLLTSLYIGRRRSRRARAA